jgi:hypothetical protein
LHMDSEHYHFLAPPAPAGAVLAYRTPAGAAFPNTGGRTIVVELAPATGPLVVTRTIAGLRALAVDSRAPESIDVRIRVGTVGEGNAFTHTPISESNSNARFERTLTAATKGELTASGVTVNVLGETLNKLESGILETGWSNTIEIKESTRGAFDTSQQLASMINFTAPAGVRIVAVQYRYLRFNNGEGNWQEGQWGDVAGSNRTNAGLLTTVDAYNNVEGNVARGTVEERTSANMTVGRATHVPSGTVNPRTIEVRFRFSIEPGFAGEIAVGVSGNAVGSSSSQVVAEAFRAITVTQPAELTAVSRDTLQTHQPYPLHDFYINETEANRLRVGDFIYFMMPGTDFIDNSQLDAPKLEIANGSALRLSAVEAVPGAQAGTAYRARVTTASGAEGIAAQIRVTDLVLTGPLVWFRANSYRIEVLHRPNSTNPTREANNSNLPTVTTGAHQFAAITNANNDAFNNRPNFVTLVTFDEQTQDPTTPPPGQQQPPAGPPTLEVRMNATNTLGAPVFETIGGVQLVNLQGLLTYVLPNGSARWDRDARVSFFDAPHSGGPMVNIAITAAGELSVRTGGVPVLPQIANAYGFRNINNTWYLPMTAFTELFGYLVDRI